MSALFGLVGASLIAGLMLCFVLRRDLFSSFHLCLVRTGGFRKETLPGRHSDASRLSCRRLEASFSAPPGGISSFGSLFLLLPPAQDPDFAEVLTDLNSRELFWLSRGQLEIAVETEGPDPQRISGFITGRKSCDSKCDS